MKIMKGARPDIEAVQDCSAKLCSLIVSCWNSDPKARPSMESVLKEIKAEIAQMAADIPDDVVCPIWYVLTQPSAVSFS
jgi:hypothetical protein